MSRNQSKQEVIVAIDIVIKREDMDRVSFPSGGSWECFPTESIEFVVSHGGGCETRHVVLDDRLDVVRGFELGGRELPLASLVLRRLEHCSGDDTVDTIVWVEGRDCVNVLDVLGMLPGVSVELVRARLESILDAYTRVLEVKSMVEVYVHDGDMRRVTLWSGLGPAHTDQGVSENTGFSIVTEGEECHYAVPLFARGIVSRLRYGQVSLAHMVLVRERLEPYGECSVVAKADLSYLGADCSDCVRDWLGDPDVHGVTVGPLRRVIDSYVGMLTDRVESPTR